jgi:hypothetical protein
MDRFRRTLLVALVLVGTASVLQGQQPAPATTVTLSPKEMDVFLRTAKIKKKAFAANGVTDTIRATFSDGRVTHDAQIQTVDVSELVFEAGGATELNFKDTYRYNIGAYRLAVLLGMNNVPMSVKRRIDGKDAAITWWIDDVQFDEHGRLTLDAKDKDGPNPERTAKQTFNRLLFDELIQNRDRNAGNSPDQQHDTLIHTQLFGTRIWELAVPNGSYSVHIVAGDPSFTDSVYKFNAEGQLALSGTPSGANHWIEGTKTVIVSDGRLTIANAAMAACKADGFDVTAAVVDRAGDLKVLLRADTANPHNADLARRKAYTSRTFKVPSMDVAKRGICRAWLAG